jgi:hypothetical protein
MIVEEAPEASIIRHVAANMRDRDLEEIRAVLWADERDEIAEYLADVYAGSVTALAFGTKEAGPIAILSWTPIRPRVWAMGLFATEAFDTIGRGVTRTAIHDIVPALSRAGAHRVFAQSMEGYDTVHAWLRFLGMTEEHPLPKFGKRGETFREFAYVRPDGLDGFRWLGPGRLG